MIVLSGLGRHCLPDIVCPYHDYGTGFILSQWAWVLDLLQQMHFTSLVFNFVLPDSFVEGNTWIRGVLRDSQKKNPGKKDQVECTRKSMSRLRQLMIGPEADEKWAAFRVEELQREGKRLYFLLEIEKLFGSEIYTTVWNCDKNIIHKPPASER
ncbi:hypothetical protein DFH07DRAFT_784991 [Mycena maculata]|uniref:Uncharacterized protein n=1 Tax=Mycena maculata TaxID=230809 RepID=A0AAD7HDF3_9AGAR|nr:hypothetical protein DFH07DRAFT_784991 [Mycena maculata]